MEIFAYLTYQGHNSRGSIMDAAYTGGRILELRKEEGLSQKELAEKLNVTDKVVSKCERGLNFPDLFAKFYQIITFMGYLLHVLEV